MAATTDRLRVDLRLRRYPCPALFDYLLAVPGTQRPAVLRHLLYLGWLAQQDPSTAASATPVPTTDAHRLEGANPDPLEIDLLQSLAE